MCQSTVLYVIWGQVWFDTTISLQLEDHFVKYPVGVLEDVLINVGDLNVPVDYDFRNGGRYAHLHNLR